MDDDDIPKPTVVREWACACGSTIEVWSDNHGRDIDCDRCGAWFNAFGQRLRDDWSGNPSLHDDDIDDLEGYERQHAGD